MTLDPHTEIALLQEALECERATWRRHWRERDQAALTAERQLAEAQESHKRTFDLGVYHQDRADKAERRLAEVREALAELIALKDMKVPEGTSLKAYRAHRAAVWNRARAALQDRAPPNRARIDDEAP